MALSITTTSPLPPATAASAYSTTLAAAGGTPAYSWSITAGSLPAGLTLTAATGVISGTPTTGGASTFTVKVTDSQNNTATAVFSLTVWSLAYAEQQATVAPAITATLSAKRGQAARLDPTSLYTNTLTDVACAVAYPANGTIVRAHLSGGNVQTQSLAAQPGSSWTSWTTLTSAYAPAAGFGVALAAHGDTVVCAFIDAATHTTAHVYRSTNDGSTWSSLYTIANTGVVTDVALAHAPNGDLLLVTGDNGGTLRAYRNGGAAVAFVPPSAAAIGSVAVAYAGDWLVLYNWQNASLNTIGSALFGNGSLQTANTWSSDVDVLGIAPGNAAQPQVCGFAWGADGGHALLVEQWAISSYTANPVYLMECDSPQAFAGGYWTEPYPFPYNGGYSGCDLAPSQVSGQGSSYVAAGENLVETLAPPATVDVSARVLAFTFHATNHTGLLTLVLDNTDQGLTSLITARGIVGQELALSLGYTTPGGTFTAAFPLRWVIRAEESWSAGRYLVTLTAHDGWQLLHQLLARRQAQFGTALGLPTRTVDQLLHWCCARAGVPYTAPATTTLNQRTPTWTILPEHNYGTAVLDLLDAIEGWLLMTPSGATTIALPAGQASSYSYGGAGQQPVLQVFHEQEVQPANLISVYIGSTPGVRPLVLAAQAFDPSDAHLMGMTEHTHNDLQLEAANAQATANALLRKAQLSVPQHSFVNLPQPGQLLGDVVSLTDPLTGAQYTGRVQALSVHYDRDRAVWQQQTTISAV